MILQNSPILEYISTTDKDWPATHHLERWRYLVASTIPRLVIMCTTQICQWHGPGPSTRGYGSIGTGLTGVPHSTVGSVKLKFLMLYWIWAGPTHHEDQSPNDHPVHQQNTRRTPHRIPTQNQHSHQTSNTTNIRRHIHQYQHQRQHMQLSPNQAPGT